MSRPQRRMALLHGGDAPALGEEILQDSLGGRTEGQDGVTCTCPHGAALNYPLSAAIPFAATAKASAVVSQHFIWFVFVIKSVLATYDFPLPLAPTCAITESVLGTFPSLGPAPLNTCANVPRRGHDPQGGSHRQGALAGPRHPKGWDLEGAHAAPALLGEGASELWCWYEARMLPPHKSRGNLFLTKSLNVGSKLTPALTSNCSRGLEPSRPRVHGLGSAGCLQLCPVPPRRLPAISLPWKAFEASRRKAELSEGALLGTWEHEEIFIPNFTLQLKKSRFVFLFL